jgi:hypothetical protein
MMSFHEQEPMRRAFLPLTSGGEYVNFTPLEKLFTNREIRSKQRFLEKKNVQRGDGLKW